LKQLRGYRRKSFSFGEAAFGFGRS